MPVLRAPLKCQFPAPGLSEPWQLPWTTAQSAHPSQPQSSPVQLSQLAATALKPACTYMSRFTRHSGLECDVCGGVTPKRRLLHGMRDRPICTGHARKQQGTGNGSHNCHIAYNVAQRSAEQLMCCRHAALNLKVIFSASQSTFPQARGLFQAWSTPMEVTWPLDWLPLSSSSCCSCSSKRA